MTDAPQVQHSLLQSKFPVFLPDMPQLRLSKDDFAAYVQTLSAKQATAPEQLSTGGNKDDSKQPADKEPPPQSAFMDALLSDKKAVPTFDERDDKMLTENADVAYSRSGSALVDLFYELEEVISGTQLRTRLEKAWAEDKDATLKIIWNARSIHLGKSNRNAFYRALGWLYENHTVTLLSNLQWLVRPVIQKKVPKKDDSTQKETPENDEKSTQEDDAVKFDEKDADSDFEMVDDEAAPTSTTDSRKRKLLDLESADAEFDVKYGVAHGYWKDLLNVLALAANDQLKADGNPSSILNTEMPNAKKYKRNWTEGRKKDINKTRHDTVLAKLAADQKYKALHLCVARLFAEQLQLDLARLESNDKKEIKKVTLVGKWAPSNKGMHDQHTTIVTSIAELLHPLESVCPDVDPADRELYIKHARNAYQVKTLSKLRKQLDIVERNLTAETFDQIKYDRVPSLAMKQYTPLFARKDMDHFDAYIEKVAQGQAKISGAVLLPSALVKEVSRAGYSGGRRSKPSPADALVAEKIREITAKSIGAQWNTLVQRIKDSGTLTSSIAVCDVSGSMSSPVFRDGTCPMDSAIGLSLLIAEVTEPPFDGAIITFHARPEVFHVGGADDKRSFVEKVDCIQSMPWGMNTDFVAVFEGLILPRAVECKVKPEDMVKQVFVFSDMQFDSATRGYEQEDRWMTSYERIQKKFKKHGYEMPKLIFWNLAGGRAGYDDGAGEVEGGDPTAPKPVTAAEEGTALVSGYSQGQLKMFLDNGQFDGGEDEEMVEVGEDGEVQGKKKDDPIAMMKKAIGHEAYRMLKVVD